MNKRTQTGFTLYELLTTVLIVGVVLTLGIPNMTEFRQNSRMTAAANDLHTSFHLARSEASRSRAIVTICASTDGATCDLANGEFEDGWIVFIDDNRDGNIDATDGNIVVDAGESVLRAFPALDDQITINSNGNSDYFSFAASGQGRGAVAGQNPVARLLFCDDRGVDVAPGGRSTARGFVATPLGRATVVSRTPQVEDIETDLGGC